MIPETITIGAADPRIVGREMGKPIIEMELTSIAKMPAVPEPATERPILPLSEIDSLDGYLRSYGNILGKHAITALQPLHVPGRDPLADFDDLLREPFPCQKHAITAAVKMLNEVGNGFIVGEMGTGKTLMGMVAVHKHAGQARRKGGLGGKFRCIILCPDHLIAKWEREIRETIPGVTVRHFGAITEGEARARRATDPRGGQAWVLADLEHFIGEAKRGNRWAKPDGPEYYVLGRNQAKWYPDWLGLSDPKRGIDGHMRQDSISTKQVIIDRVPVLNEFDRPTYNTKGEPVMRNVTARAHYCPSCGTVPRDKKGAILDAKALSKAQVKCSGRYLQSQPVLDQKGVHGRDRIRVPSKHAGAEVGQEVSHAGKKWVVKECGERLWHYVSKPYRWAPARTIQKRMRRFFDYLIIDEVHEQKSDESAQSMACGKLIASARHTIALTGTIIGGYANHLYPLMIRMNPDSLRNEGFEWGKDLAFSEVYGRIDRIVTVKEDDPGPTVGKNVKSMRRAKSGKSSERKAVRPGVMPTMFGKHLLGSSMFITLDELADELPDLDEFVEDGACLMTEEQRAEYLRITGIMEAENRDLLKRGSMKFLGAYLWTSMDYPDRPFGWGHEPEVSQAFADAQAQALAEGGEEAASSVRLPHTIGYWLRPGSKTIGNWVGVVTPADLPEDVVYPKEQKLLDICKAEKAAGTQVWVYVQMTGKRNVQPRLKALLEREGLKVGVLRSGDVDPKEREDWIARHGREFDVMISHPKLVSTGLDLFSKAQGGHNYATIVFYETGYNLFDMRQAARRAWRIGQPKDCKVYYLYYRETMQHRAMQLMSRKMAAAQALEGEFSAEGLAAMAGEDNLQMALAKSLAERIDEADMQRSWSKVKSGPKKPRKIAQPGDGSTMLAPSGPINPSPLDALPIELQLACEAIIESQLRAAAKEEAATAVKMTAVEPEPGIIILVTPDPEPTEAEATVGISPTVEPESVPTILIMRMVDREPVAAKPTMVMMTTVHPEPELPKPRVYADREPKPEAEEAPGPEPTFWPQAEGDDEPDVIPVLTEEILAKMFANLMAYGMTLEDMAG